MHAPWFLDLKKEQSSERYALLALAVLVATTCRREVAQGGGASGY